MDTRNYLESRTLVELKKVCKTANLSGYSSLKKKELVDLMIKSKIKKSFAEKIIDEEFMERLNKKAGAYGNNKPKAKTPKVAKKKASPDLSLNEEIDISPVIKTKPKTKAKPVTTQDLIEIAMKSGIVSPKKAVAKTQLPSGILYTSLILTAMQNIDMYNESGDRVKAIENAEIIREYIEKYYFNPIFKKEMELSIASVINTFGSPNVKKKITKKKSPFKKGDYKSVDILSIKFGKKGDPPVAKTKAPAKINITLEELRAEIDKDEFIDEYTQSVKDLMRAKIGLYQKRKEEVQKEYDSIDRKVKKLRAMGTEDRAIRDMYPGFDGLKVFIIDLEDLITLVRNRSTSVTSRNIREGLIDAIEDPDNGLNSIIGRDDIKNQLASQIYSFSKGYKTFIGSFNNIAIYGSAGVGKCLHPDTPVMLYDGTIKKAKDIEEGDYLMGDDSTPRTVLSTCTGKDEMYKITPMKGDPYIVNKPHILSLKRSYNPTVSWDKNCNLYRVKWCDSEGNNKNKSFTVSQFKSKEIAKEKADEFKENIGQSEIVIDISVEEYIKKSDSWKKQWKGYRTGVEFEESENPAIDPYLIGLWLGDVPSPGSSITNIDPEILDYLGRETEIMNMYVHKVGAGEKEGITYYLGGNEKRSNPFLKELQKQNLIKNKHIPHCYKTSSRENRLKLLAGLIDTDGSISNNCYDIIQKNSKLTEDILFVARSCGFSAYSKKCKKGCWYLGEYRKGEYNRITISGEISEIPVLIPRKKANKRKQVKNVLHTGITVEHIGKGTYCGFELDGNHRFLLGDFTVTHNTAIAKVIAYAFSKVGILARDTVKIVTRADLVGQYVGHTAPRTRSVLIETLEGILFIDEAYQLTECPDAQGTRKDAFGSEAVTEIVNFLDKYIGLNIVIVAGYEGIMNRCFMTFNEGLPRRFPYKYILSPYSDHDLTDILMSNLKRKLPEKLKMDEATSNFIFSLVSKIRVELPDAFKNQAGDMLNLSASLNKTISSSFKIKWKNGDLANNVPIILAGFDDFLETKGFSLYT